MILEQKKVFRKERFTLVEDGVQIEVRGFDTEPCRVLPYTSIPVLPIKITDTRTELLAGLGLLTLFGMITGGMHVYEPVKEHATQNLLVVIGVFVIAGVLGLIYTLTKKKHIVFSDGQQSLILDARKPSEREVEDFIERMHQEKIAYLERRIKRAMKSDAGYNLPGVLSDLVGAGLISEAQADQLETDLSLEQQPCGFGFASRTAS